MADPPKHLLIVDDERALREAVAERLADQGFVVEQADERRGGARRLSEFAFDVLITDLRLPGIDGRQVLEAALERYPEIVAIVITGYGTVKDAVDAIKQGAADFITKPFQFDALLHVLSSAMEQRRLKSENAYLRSQLEERYRIDGLVGRSAVDARPASPCSRSSPRPSSTVLITGETGTGKELAAQGDSPQQPAAGAALRRHQLQRDPGNAARGRAVRPRARRLHRRGCQPPGPASSRRTRARCSSTRSGR